MPESRAQTRYADEESAEVLVLQRWSVNKKEKVAVLTLLDGGEISIPLAKNRLSKKEWRKLSVVLMRQVVRVRAHDAPRRVSRSKLEMLGLHYCLYLGSREWDEAILRVALLGKDGALMSLDGGLAHEDCDLEYRDDLGYRVIRN
jgi:CRISPR-associated endonuclease/helicase Cas3